MDIFEYVHGCVDELDDDESFVEIVIKDDKALSDIVTNYCCTNGCDNCPVKVYGYEKRTEYEKDMLHTPCVDNLFKWVKENVDKIGGM